MCHPGKVRVSWPVVYPPLEGVLHVLDSKGKVNVNFTSLRTFLANGYVAKAGVITSLLAYIL